MGTGEPPPLHNELECLDGLVQVKTKLEIHTSDLKRFATSRPMKTPMAKDTQVGNRASGLVVFGCMGSIKTYQR